MKTRALILYYNSINKAMYPPTVWEPRFFPTLNDEVPFGSREQRCRIHKRNHARRHAHMVQVLKKRIEILEDMGNGKFEPLFDMEIPVEPEVDYAMGMEIMVDPYFEEPLEETEELYPLDGVIANL